MLPPLSAALKKASSSIRGVEGISFSIGRDSGWTTPPQQFVWGLPPVSRAFDPSSVKVPREVAIFRETREQFLQEARDAYGSEELKLRQQRDAMIDAQVKKFVDWVRQPPHQASPCTQFEDLAVRLYSQRRPLNLVITDGVFDCPPRARGRFQASRFDGKIIILMVPSFERKTEISEDARYRQRERDLLAMFPSAVILRPYDIEKLPSLLEANANTGVNKPIEADILRHNREQPRPEGDPVRRASDHATRASTATVDSPLKNQVEADLHSIIRRKQLENVRLSWGPNSGECFTNQDLQEMISTRRAAKVAEALKHDRFFLKLAIAAKELSSADRMQVGDSTRTAFHKTWTERGIVDADGQTTAGVEAELIIAGAIIEEFQNLVDTLSVEELASLLLEAGR